MKATKRPKKIRPRFSLNQRLTAILFLTAAVCILIYLSVSLDIKNEVIITEVTIKGNTYLDGSKYLEFGRLSSSNDLKHVNLAIIKDRIEKHPYVKKAGVKFGDVEMVEINIIEKNFECMMLTGNNQYLLTENFEVNPYMNFTRNIDLPVINDPLIENKIVIGSSLKANNDLRSAFKIIASIKKINPELYKNLNEIELRKGKDILVSFTNNDFRVIMGRGNEIRKTFYLNRVWQSLRRNENYDSLNYIDLRFNGLAYLGYS